MMVMKMVGRSNMKSQREWSNEDATVLTRSLTHSPRLVRLFVEFFNQHRILSVLQSQTIVEHRLDRMYVTVLFLTVHLFFSSLFAQHDVTQDQHDQSLKLHLIHLGSAQLDSARLAFDQSVIKVKSKTICAANETLFQPSNLIGISSSLDTQHIVRPAVHSS